MRRDETRPKWKPKRGRCHAVDRALTEQCRAPAEWPSIRKPFKEVFLMKTSEGLLFTGSAGAWVIAQLDISEEVRTPLISLLRMLEVAMHKVSTPGDRQKLKVELPAAVAALDVVLPVYVSTMVMHVVVFHTLSTLEMTGPFTVANMLQIERFQTVFKSCARGTKDAMMSIRNHYLLLETALCNRLSRKQTWSIDAPRSTAAGFAAREGSTNRKDRLWKVSGRKRFQRLDDTDFGEIVSLWRKHDKEYDEFWKRFLSKRRRDAQNNAVTDIREWSPERHHNNISAKEREFQNMEQMVESYGKVRYAGYKFCTVSSQRKTKTNNSLVRMPYSTVENRRRVTKSAYGGIRAVLVHHQYPGGLPKCVLYVDWYQNVGTAPISGNPMIDTTRIDWSSFVFIEDCYQIPLAIWPHDPLDLLPASNPAGAWWEVIDKNQEEQQ